MDCEPQWFTGGASVGDLDGDGWPEIYMTRLAAPDHLFLNQGDGTFVDVAEQVGLGGCSWTNGVNFGDVDNDGDLDLLLTTVGDYSYQLWMNQLVETGALGFVEEGEARGFALSSPTMHSGESVTLGDYDRDGWLDLHVNEWLRLEQAPQPGDPGFASHRARLLRNTGGGYFLDRTEALGVDLWGADVDGTFAFSSTFADLDDDGWQDLAITVDFHRSRLFWNPGAEDPGGPFIDGSVAAKINRESNAMGSSFADVDLDGAFDWFVTSIAESRPCDIDEQPPCWAGSGNRLYRYFGAREFQLYTDLAGVRDAAWAWGASFFDADNDGDPDLAVANGWPGRDISGGLYHADTPMRLWLNQGVGVMSEEGEARGVDDRGQGRGLVSFDYDRDGDLDLLVINHAGQPRLLRNDGGNALPWLQVEVEGQVSNRDGRGAKIRVQVTVEGPTQIREVGVGSHFLGEGELVQHFGLGPDFDPALDRIYRVEVEWPASGAVQVFEQIEAGQRLQVLEAL
nr:CRTAC1 family protein [Pseudenhygromyxa sp. WMMC2535]